MKRMTLLGSVLALTALVLAGGPAAGSAEARTCWKAQHPNDRSYGVACNDGQYTACDASNDRHVTWLRVWGLQPSSPGTSPGGRPVPTRAPGSKRDGFVVENSYSTAHDTFGRYDGRGRRVKRICTPGKHPGFGIAAISVCVAREGCSRPLALYGDRGKIPG